ncbi:stress protein [Sutcliffiella horikoshii]|uniref:Stress protein n=1 Tax=Sutcliffiella horikoshii TaxID=79883 RepID=A0A1Y0CKV0_9BACI|nr:MULTISPECIES: hypothetical protein [Bacillaceae]ART75909.1 stress protein [Sutcliffiella horikoshii]TYS61179.1 stress protein [Sutcliffiella horikoshii]TYS73591.1 stress protein [Sutcliffiella horikoshii]
MSRKLHQALEKQREYYINKLLLIGVYDSLVLDGMTTTELKTEYNYFFYDVPSKKVSTIKKA